jgi:hypothetical protein
MTDDRAFKLKVMIGTHTGPLESRLQGLEPAAVAAGVIEDSALVHARASKFLGDMDGISTDPRLSAKGQQEKRESIGRPAFADARGWREKHQARLERAHAVDQRAIDTASAVTAPSEAAVNAMALRVANLEVSEVRRLYSMASPSEQRVLEAVAAQLGGRVPSKKGSMVAWSELLDPEDVRRARLARGAAANPAAARRLADIELLMGVYNAIGRAAEAVIADELRRYGIVVDRPEDPMTDPRSGLRLDAPPAA